MDGDERTMRRHCDVHNFRRIQMDDGELRHRCDSTIHSAVEPAARSGRRTGVSAALALIYSPHAICAGKIRVQRSTSRRLARTPQNIHHFNNIPCEIYPINLASTIYIRLEWVTQCIHSENSLLIIAIGDVIE